MNLRDRKHATTRPARASPAVLAARGIAVREFNDHIWTLTMSWFTRWRTYPSTDDETFRELTNKPDDNAIRKAAYVNLKSETLSFADGSLTREEIYWRWLGTLPVSPLRGQTFDGEGGTLANLPWRVRRARMESWRECLKKRPVGFGRTSCLPLAGWNTNKHNCANKRLVSDTGALGRNSNCAKFKGSWFRLWMSPSTPQTRCVRALQTRRSYLRFLWIFKLDTFRNTTRHCLGLNQKVKTHATNLSETMIISMIFW